MLLDRMDNLPNEIVNQRIKEFGKTIGTWICNYEECKTKKTSFLYNYEFHIPKECDICDIGKMIEDESRREKPSGAAVIRGKQGEDAWMSSQPPHIQTGVLLGDDPKY